MHKHPTAGQKHTLIKHCRLNIINHKNRRSIFSRMSTIVYHGFAGSCHARSIADQYLIKFNKVRLCWNCTNIWGSCEILKKSHFILFVWFCFIFSTNRFNKLFFYKTNWTAATCRRHIPRLNIHQLHLQTLLAWVRFMRGEVKNILLKQVVCLLNPESKSS